MKTSEVNNDLIGRRCEGIFTGLMVKGTIISIEEDEFVKAVEFQFDEPVNWGNYLYTKTQNWARKFDEFGSLHHLHLI